MADSGLLDQLIESLRCLPGVGPKSAQRMAFSVLERDRDGAERMARILLEALERIGRCKECRTLTEDEVCRLCSNPQRDGSLLCIVETPADIHAVEQAGAYSGRYFVLMGRLSPLDGVGPAELGLESLEKRLARGEVKEIIIATSATVEGEATAHYLGEMAREHKVRATRIAHGVPLGGELEYIDRTTLAHAFSGRRDL